MCCTEERNGAVAFLTSNLSVLSSNPIKSPIVSLRKKLNTHCLVLVGSRNGFLRDFTIKLKINGGPYGTSTIMSKKFKTL